MSAPRQLPGRGALRTSLALLSLAVAPLLLTLPASPAHAAGDVTATSSLGNGAASADGATTITVSGTGLQSIPKAFGGIYVVFGYAPNTGAWAPSQGGKSGTDFFYVADSQAKDNSGYQRFVAFPGSTTSDSANGGILGEDGSFSLSMVIPGPTFSAETAGGASQSFDCRNVQCGIFTFGAHGVVNANNETFTPVSFGAAPAAPQGDEPISESDVASAPDAAAEPDPAGASPQGSTTEPAQSSDAGNTPTPATTGKASVGVAQKTVIAGNVLSFTGQGFAPGEQVAATLSAGATAAGPVVAGIFGEIAGAVQIPADMVAGTHKLTLIGAGSKSSATVEFSVMANPAVLTSAGQDEPNGIWWALVAVVAAAAVLFLIVLVSLVTALTRRRAASRRVASGRKPVPEAGTDPTPDTGPELDTAPVPDTDLDTAALTQIHFDEHTRELV